MFDLLSGVRVLDLATLAPDVAGMHLADLGADVIKIEMPPYGDNIRTAPGRLREGAPSFSHLRWNRSKSSLALNLKTPDGVRIFQELVAKSDVVIEGSRAGTMDRLGVGYAALRKVNPAIVYCAISGNGQTGPYVRLGLHGLGIDGVAGVAPVAMREDGVPYIGDHISYGTRVGGLYAALATLAAVIKAKRTGEGSFIDLAETDAAAFASAEVLFQYLNTGQAPQPGAFKSGVRYQAYRTRDGKHLMFQAFEFKFWKKFCEAVNRPDLIYRGGDKPDARPDDLNGAFGNEELRREIAEIMLTRTQREWTEFFIEQNIVGSPMNSMTEMLDDPQFQARGNIYEIDDPELGRLKMPSTPIKIPGHAFGARPAPKPGQHTDNVLREVLGYDDEQIVRLRADKVVT